MQFGRVGLADTGLNLKPRILSSIFSRVFQILAWKYLFCVQQEVFVVFIFPYFVPSWYILAQSLVKTFPKWKYFFFFFYSQVADNCSKLFFKDEHSYKQNILANKANFFPGVACYLQNLLSPVNQSRKLPIRLSYFTDIVEVIVFWAHQKFSI